MDELFDEMTELEIVMLTDEKNELLNELEAMDQQIIPEDEQRRAEIQNDLDKIYENLDLIY